MGKFVLNLFNFYCHLLSDATNHNSDNLYKFIFLYALLSLDQ